MFWNSLVSHFPTKVRGELERARVNSHFSKSHIDRGFYYGASEEILADTQISWFSGPDLKVEVAAAPGKTTSCLQQDCFISSFRHLFRLLAPIKLVSESWFFSPCQWRLIPFFLDICCTLMLSHFIDIILVLAYPSILFVYFTIFIFSSKASLISLSIV